jgi:hypothetical protein
VYLVYKLFNCAFFWYTFNYFEENGHLLIGFEGVSSGKNQLLISIICVRGKFKVFTILCDLNLKRIINVLRLFIKGNFQFI